MSKMDINDLCPDCKQKIRFTLDQLVIKDRIVEQYETCTAREVEKLREFILSIDYDFQCPEDHLETATVLAICHLCERFPEIWVEIHKELTK